jgi:glyceraldehyde-3-phosphate dehydrogenase (NAD(P))
VCDFVAQVEKPTIAEEINQTLKNAAEGSMKGIIEVCEEPLVSGDFKGNDASSIVDASLTMVMGGNLFKIVAWYDNEWGYSQRVLDLAEYVAQKW